MDISDLIYNAAIIWGVLNLVCMFIFLYLLLKTKKIHFIWLSCACLLKSMWGLTIPGIDIQAVKFFNGVIIPPVAAIFVFLGAIGMYREWKLSIKRY